MITREAKYGDLSEIAKLFDDYRQFYGQEPDLGTSTDFIRKRLKLNDSVLLVAIEEESFLGFTQLYPSFSSVSVCRIFLLNDLFVGVKARNRGVGNALLKAAEDYAMKKDAIRLSLATQIKNKAARHLYEKRNWETDNFFIHYNKNIVA